MTDRKKKNRLLTAVVLVYFCILTALPLMVYLHSNLHVMVRETPSSEYVSLRADNWHIVVVEFLLSIVTGDEELDDHIHTVNNRWFLKIKPLTNFMTVHAYDPPHPFFITSSYSIPDFSYPPEYFYPIYYGLSPPAV